MSTGRYIVISSGGGGREGQVRLHQISLVRLHRPGGLKPESTNMSNYAILTESCLYTVESLNDLIPYSSLIKSVAGSLVT